MPADFAELDRIIAEAEAKYGQNGKATPKPAAPDNDLLSKLRPVAEEAFRAILGQPLIRKVGSKEPVALCPFHDDHHPSLSINLEKLTWYCHTQCKRGGGIIELAKRLWGLEFKDVARRLEEVLNLGRKTGGKPSQKFEVRNLNGDVVATHLRYDQPDGSKSMPWQPAGIKPVDLPLYQIEKTADSSDGDAVIVTEGEKAAQKLWDKHQTLAVGTVTGAGQIPCDDSLKALDRFRVYLWADNDTEGRKHMDRLGARLLKLGHTEVWMVNWAEAPEKGDAADFDGDVAALVEQAQRFGAIAPSNGHLPASEQDLLVTYADRLPVEATAEWARITSEPREYATGGLIRIASDAAISGLMGAGKTTLMANLVRGWATGTPVLDRESIKAKVLVVTSPKEFENWLETISLWGLVDQVFVVESLKAHDRSPEDQARWFDAVMRIYRCRAYALDTLFDFYGTPPTHSADQNRLVMNEQAPFLQVVRERAYWGVVGGHQTKAEAKSDTPRDPEEAFAGHTGWMAQHRMRVSLRRKGHNAIAIITGKGGYGDRGILEEQLLSYDDATRLVKLDGPFAKHLGKAALPEVLETLRAIGKWTAIDKLCKEIGRGEKFVRPGLKEGIAQGLIKDNGRRTRGKMFAPADWTPEQEQDDLFVDKAS